MALYRINIEMDAEDISREDFIEMLLAMPYKDWKYEVQYLSDTEEELEWAKRNLASLRKEADNMGWTKELRLLQLELLDEIEDLRQAVWEEEE